LSSFSICHPISRNINRDQVEIAKFVMQVASSAGRLKISAGTRAPLLQWATSNLLDGVHHMIPLIMVKNSSDLKERNSMGISWLEAAASTEERVCFISELLENISEYSQPETNKLKRSKNEKKGEAELLTNLFSFLSSVTCKRPCEQSQLVVLAFFDSIVNLCFNTSASVQAKKLVRAGLLSLHILLLLLVTVRFLLIFTGH
jgi:hypothetical protein